MVRNFVMAAVLSTAATLAFASPASAQSYGGVTLSFGSGGYDRYDGDEYRVSEQPRYDPYYQERREAWLARQRYEQHERWEQQERARREYWWHERQEHRQWHRDDDD
jgi:hypothetical protein